MLALNSMKCHISFASLPNMTIHEYAPSQALKPFVKVYKVIETELGIINRVLPSTSVALAVRFRGKAAYVQDNDKISLPTCTLSGLRKTVRLIQYAPHSSSVVILFTELGASLFFRQSLTGLFEQTISLDSVLPKYQVTEVSERIEEALDNKERMKVIDNFLLAHLNLAQRDLLIGNAIAAIHRERGNLRIKSLATSMAIGQDALEKRFRKATGTTPKHFASIVRMNALVRKVPKQRTILDSVFEGGYYDQAHFCKEFKLFTGLTPKHFFQAVNFW
jgi:methylphosphotriester-DNA--protein-cysteine methyltransferase